MASWNRHTFTVHPSSRIKFKPVCSIAQLWFYAVGCNVDLAECHEILGKRTFRKGGQLCQMLARGKLYPL